MDWFDRVWRGRAWCEDRAVDDSNLREGGVGVQARMGQSSVEWGRVGLQSQIC